MQDVFEAKSASALENVFEDLKKYIQVKNKKIIVKEDVIVETPLQAKLKLYLDNFASWKAQVTSYPIDYDVILTMKVLILKYIKNINFYFSNYD